MAKGSAEALRVHLPVQKESDLGLPRGRRGEIGQRAAAAAGQNQSNHRTTYRRLTRGSATLGGS
eukprot:3567820-Prorocentrum_lima.AAC.1